RRGRVGWQPRTAGRPRPRQGPAAGPAPAADRPRSRGRPPAASGRAAVGRDHAGAPTGTGAPQHTRQERCNGTRRHDTGTDSARTLPMFERMFEFYRMTATQYPATPPLLSPRNSRRPCWFHGGSRTGDRYGLGAPNRAGVAFQPLRRAGRPVGEHRRFAGRAAVRPGRYDRPPAPPQGPRPGPPRTPPGRRRTRGYRLRTPLATGQPPRRRDPPGRAARRRDRPAGPDPAPHPAVPGRRRGPPDRQAPPG